jgi:hypothetical protein
MAAQEENPVKKFYSTEDIEALAARGVTELVVDEDTVLTHLAREIAHKLGVSVVYGATTKSAPRPQLTSQKPRLGAKPKGCQHGPLPGQPAGRAAGSSAGSSDQAVRELVDLVKGLSKGDGG